MFTSYVLASSVLDLVYILSCFGFNLSVVKFQDIYDYKTTIFNFTLLLGGIIFILSSIVIFFVTSDIVYISIFVVLSFVKFASLPLSVLISILDKDFLHFKIGIIECISKLLAFLIGLLLIINNFLISSLLVRDLVYITFQFTFFYWILKIPLKLKINFNDLKKTFNFSLTLFFVRIFEIFNKQFFVYFYNYYNSSIIPLYDRAIYLVTLPNTLLSPLNQKVFFSYYSNNKTSLNRKFILLDYNLFFIIPILLYCSLFIYKFPDSIISLVLGPLWIDLNFFLSKFAFLVTLLPLYSVLLFYYLNQGNYTYIFVSKIISMLLIVSYFLYCYCMIIDPTIYLGEILTLSTLLSCVVLLLLNKTIFINVINYYIKSIISLFIVFYICSIFESIIFIFISTILLYTILVISLNYKKLHNFFILIKR